MYFYFLLTPLFLRRYYYKIFGLGSKKGTFFCRSEEPLYVDEADPRPVQDCVPHVDRHHIRSSPDGARLVHEWIHDARPVHIYLT